MTLKELRKSRGVTQAEFAKELDISRVSYVRFETGVRIPPPDIARRIGKAFNLSGGQIWAMFYDRPA